MIPAGGGLLGGRGGGEGGLAVTDVVVVVVTAVHVCVHWGLPAVKSTRHLDHVHFPDAH